MQNPPFSLAGKRRRRSASCALGLLLAAATSQAAVISGAMYESFAYAPGTQFTNGSTLNGGTGWNGTGTQTANAANANWGTFQVSGSEQARTATSPGLVSTAVGYYNGDAGKLTLNAGFNNVNTHAGRALGGQTIDAGTTYFSFLISKNNDSNRTINMAFFGGTGNTEQFAIGQIGAGAGNSGGNIALLMNNQNPAGMIQNPSPISMGIGITHLVVGRIDWNAAGNETVSVWVDPTDVTTETAAGTAYLTTGGFNIASITGIRPFVGNASTGAFTAPAVSANFDEIRFGGDWNSVVAVPEVSASLLVGLAGLLGLTRRRR